MAIRRVLGIGMLVAGCALAPARASADWVLTPFVGVTFGGDAEEEKVTYGGSLGYMGGGVFGFEVDFGHTPDFLGGDDPFGFIDNSRVTTLMGNLILGAPLGRTTGARPYVSAGAGLLRTRVETADAFFDVDESSFGVNAGAGIMAFLQENVGIRADVRYFRNVQDNDAGDGIDLDLGGFNFWRGTVGVTFRF